MPGTNRKEFQKLVDKYLNGTASQEELGALDRYYLLFRDEPEITGSFDQEQLAALEARMENKLFHRIQEPVKVTRLWPRIAAAASILIVLGAGTYMMLNRNPKLVVANDVAPFTAMAILKSGGKTIILDSAANGKIAQTNVTKSVGEQLSYEGRSDEYIPAYDTIEIPKGGRPYTVKLSDGSKITLNAATILRYPETFSKNRKEEIELIGGEIYAEVVHNTAAPLQIKAPGQLITDVGTEFNIAAYADEPDSRTTLVEGAVKVRSGSKEKLLSPGRQAIRTADNLRDTAANIVQTTAWKNGLFRFNGEHIDVIMRQLSRWYNIEVKYEGKMPDEVFYARVTRKRNISEVLTMLEKTNKVHFKIEGRRVTVSRKS